MAKPLRPYPSPYINGGTFFAAFLCSLATRDNNYMSRSFDPFYIVSYTKWVKTFKTDSIFWEKINTITFS